MNSAALTTVPSLVRPAGRSSRLGRLSRRVGLALLAWSRGSDRRRSPESLAELHERQQEAERLRNDRFREVTFSRLM
ncbi:hypothetical protein JOE59_002717 [Agromyces cerinus]|uniref:hypothetical protein n=1 Tax=Agromyces cerinus TaxID=33878 RepID=UPI0019578820|nr:hypothetical protein [Agromyces cerinus]MBM7832012.1 hypothetical protein [Agromyces cerinus]